ncbi:MULTISPECIES: AzlD domain-containing protein [unclassified Aureimonas]|uniref:AzlD domain-containing protein n=1 Tax=unclassified Aureimonas TaxID=2615206 RepID=UPI0006FC16FD|nr:MULTISPECIES: AzlD domain-containing protein [unclassified Aureimonas]KQT60304.1 branched-chain amino acid transport [Aureimonas sp. Leaf427]KQT79180.1 branched-chain amino acid transport [Aureimonas sp. Leaf460]
MSALGYHDVAAAWWPYAFILLAGWLPTDMWRWIGVASAGRIDENSRLIALARAVATALVAAVIARLVFYPTGSLAAVPDAVRVGALAAGFLSYILLGRHILLGCFVAEAILLGVPYLMG